MAALEISRHNYASVTSPMDFFNIRKYEDCSLWIING